VRVKYEIEGVTYAMRTYTIRDIQAVTGKLGILPMGGAEPGAGVSAWKSNEMVDALLARCSKSPKLTLDEPDEIPEGTVPVSELPQSVWVELIGRLAKDSGFSAEAEEEVRPSCATVEGS
jgi:hypothetical protein